MAQNKLKMGSFYLCVWCTITYGKLMHFSDPFLTHIGPKTAHFQGILGFSLGKVFHHRLKMGYQHLFEHPGWSRKNFGKNHLFLHGDPGRHTVGPHRARPRLPSGSTK